jgi:hypothetical protein
MCAYAHVPVRYVFRIYVSHSPKARFVRFEVLSVRCVNATLLGSAMVAAMGGVNRLDPSGRWGGGRMRHAIAVVACGVWWCVVGGVWCVVMWWRVVACGGVWWCVVCGHVVVV